jgi:hypothetical protein
MIFALFSSLLGCGSGIHSSLTLLPSTVTVKLDTPNQLHLMFTQGFEPVEDVTSSATWETSSENVSITHGLVTCQQAGKFQVVGIFGTLYASAAVACVASPATTTPPTTTTTPPATTPPPPPSSSTPSVVVVGIRITNPQAVVRSETPYTFSATADYSDGSSADVSSIVTWTGTSSVVYIASTGTAYCNTAGNASISAQLGAQTVKAFFTCILKQVTPTPGFAEHAEQFDGPFSSWMNVQTVFGAKGDGVTDDTQALQNALNSLAGQPAVLWIPKGTYIITAPLRMPITQGFSIVGEDPLTTLIKWHGPVGGTMLDIEGCKWFRVARLSWDGMNLASVAIRIASTLTNGENYPTYDDVEDQQISRVGIGLEIGFAGETSVQRVHFDHNSVAGIDLENWNALNFNVVDSLFTDCTVGVTNMGEAGAFNVSNSVFVRSQTADMMMGNTGPFSERQNISFDSQAFFVAAGIGASANVLLQANTIITPTADPIQIANPGPIMLIDNHFVDLNPSLNIFAADGYNPVGVFSMGNEFTVATPFAGNLGKVVSLDEAPYSSDSPAAFNIPSQVYVPPPSNSQVFEIPVGSSSDSIQQIVNEAVAVQAGAVVHFPAGTFQISRTIEIPDSQDLAVVGDGPLTVLAGSTSLTGPIVHITGTHVRMENLQIGVGTGPNVQPALEIDVDDQPSTSIHCDQCKTFGAAAAVQTNGLDNASVDFRITEMNASLSGLGALIVGGRARQAGYQTLGRVDAFMTSSDAYEVTDGGHFVIEDGWHDTGQGPVQFSLIGSGAVTHEGGTIYTDSASDMTTKQYDGRISLLGIATDSTFVIDSASDAEVMTAGTVQVSNTPIVVSDSSTAQIGQLANFSVLNNGTPTPFADELSSPAWTEHMFSQARTDYVVPRIPLATVATSITLHRVLVGAGNAGLLIAPTRSVAISGAYSITSTAANGAGGQRVSSCSSGSIPMSGAWTLQGNGDGFYGLQSDGNLFLSNRANISGPINGIGLSTIMSDAGQRWIVRPTGDGFFNIINRASGEVLTSDPAGCASLSPANGETTQEWAVNFLGAPAN